MAQFNFQLDPVLRHRKNIERDRQRFHAQLQRQMQQFQDELKALDRTAHDATEELRAQHLVGTIDLNYLAAHRRFTAAVQRKGMTLVQKMALLQRQIDDSRKLLADAAIRRRIMEKLKDKHFERWRLDLNRRETAQTDEIGMQLAFRQLVEAQTSTD